MRFFALLLVFFATAASAQLRTIPKEARLGELRHLQDMVVELNGKPQNLSAGAQIRDTENRLVVPASLTSKTLVGYQLDGAGHVHRVWILSPRERAMLPKAPAVTLPAEK